MDDHVYAATDRFRWTVFDVRSMLPIDWEARIVAAVKSFARPRVLITGHSTSREGRPDYRLAHRSVDGNKIADHLPWLRHLYDTEFRSMAQATTMEPVSVMTDNRFAIVINVHTSPDRYECHIDTNPIEALLFVTTHREGEGGELVVSNREQARSVEEVDADATIIEPKAGYLALFDGRKHSHYVSSPRDPGLERIAVTMNYYVPSWPESLRPLDLNRHLSGDD